MTAAILTLAPLPWSQGTDALSLISSADGRAMCEVYDYPSEALEDHDLAAFIVHRMNSWDALRASLDALLHPSYWTKSDAERETIVADALAALTAANKEPTS